MVFSRSLTFPFCNLLFDIFLHFLSMTTLYILLF